MTTKTKHNQIQRILAAAGYVVRPATMGGRTVQRAIIRRQNRTVAA